MGLQGLVPAPGLLMTYDRKIIYVVNVRYVDGALTVCQSLDWYSW
jgi:hypothetical protein